MPIPHVVPYHVVRAAEQNALIDQVNQNTEDIAALQVPGGDLEVVQALINGSIATHVADATPHPTYDDMPDLTLILQNGLV